MSNEVEMGTDNDTVVSPTPTPNPNAVHTQTTATQTAAEGSSQPQAAVANATCPQPAERKRKQMAKRSKVWDHFHHIDDKNCRTIEAKCMYCGQVYQAESGKNGTSSLKAHMLACKRNPHSLETKQQLLVFQPAVVNNSDNDGMGSLGTWKFSQEAVRDAVAFMIIVDKLPFRFVERLGFNRLMNVACPRFKMPSRSTVTRDCYQLYLDERLKLRAFLHNHSRRISLTTDSWTSLQKINYMCGTCHWIDDE